MKRILFISLLCFLIGCSKENQVQNNEHPDNDNPVQTIFVDFDDLRDDLNMSDFFSEISYIHLNNPDGEPIGRIQKIMIQGQYLGFYDESTNKIWIYSKNGNYINNIDIPEGRGPGEIQQMSDVILTADGLIHALGAFKIVVYNLHGEFIRETNFDFYIYKFEYLDSNDEYVGYAGNSLNIQLNNEHTGHNLIFFDIDGQITDSAIPVPKGREHMRLLVSNNFPNFNGQNLFFPHLSDTVYHLDTNQTLPRYILDYGNKSIPEEVFSRRENYSRVVYEWVEFRQKEIIEKDYVLRLVFFNETNRFIHFGFGTGSSQFNAFYHKETEVIAVGPGRLKNDIDFAYVPFTYESSNDALFSIIEAGDLLRHLNDLYQNEPEKYSNPKMHRFIDLGQTLTPNSNPILQTATFKTID